MNSTIKKTTLFLGACMAFQLGGIPQMLAAPSTSMEVMQQTKRITGTVKDATGMEVIGANVIVKGTTNGVITDLDGKFSLEAAPGSIIEISYIGYMTQEIPVTAQTSDLQITLKEDSQSLDEVVVVGYGVQKKKLVTGATLQVKGENIQKLNTTNPLGALQSQSPGVNIVANSGQPVLSIAEHLPEQLVHAAALLLADLIHRLLQQNAALVDEDHVVQHVLHVGDQVGGDHQGGILIIIAENGVDDIVPGGGVHAADGLVQQIQPGPPAHDQDQLHLFPGALAHLPDPQFRADLQGRQHMLGGVPVEIRIEVAEKVQQLHHVHPPGQIRPLRQIGHQLLGLRPRGMAVDGDNAAAGDQQAVGQLDQGGLAAAVGA